VGLESVLGFTSRTATRSCWRRVFPTTGRNSASAIAADGGGSYEIVVRNPQRSAGTVRGASLDGVALAVESGVARIPLRRDGGEHRVELVLG
jgi:hypothetical protein